MTDPLLLSSLFSPAPLYTNAKIIHKEIPAIGLQIPKPIIHKIKSTLSCILENQRKKLNLIAIQLGLASQLSRKERSKRKNPEKLILKLSSKSKKKYKINRPLAVVCKPKFRKIASEAVIQTQEKEKKKKEEKRKKRKREMKKYGFLFF